MAVDSENVEQLVEWLSDESPARRAHAAAGSLVAKLAALVFQGDADWPNHPDRVDAYCDALDGWFAGDRGQESAFSGLTGHDGDLGALVDWFLPVVAQWEQRAAQFGADTAPGGATVAGLPNPNSDGTPGTEFYRFEEATGRYLYSASAEGGDWASYEQRRREYDLASAAQAPAGGATAEWDENWAMFYRIGPGGVYEFADAVTPGDQFSGCTDEWLSHEQVLQRQGQAGADQSPDPEILAALDEAIKAAVTEQLAELGDGAGDGDDGMSAEELTEFMDEVRKIMLGEVTE